MDTRHKNRKGAGCIVLPLYLLLAITLLASPASAQRTKYNFNAGWKLQVGDITDAQAVGYDDATWKNITLPRAWNW